MPDDPTPVVKEPVLNVEAVRLAVGVALGALGLSTDLSTPVVAVIAGLYGLLSVVLSIIARSKVTPVK